jgi:hypothetical protein
MGKKDYAYFRTLNWEELKRWTKYGTDTDTNWRDLATVLADKADEEIAYANDAGCAVGYHHWDSN